jgi:hypothetical protein
MFAETESISVHPVVPLGLCSIMNSVSLLALSVQLRLIDVVESAVAVRFVGAAGGAGGVLTGLFLLHEDKSREMETDARTTLAFKKIRIRQPLSY